MSNFVEKRNAQKYVGNISKSFEIDLLYFCQIRIIATDFMLAAIKIRRLMLR